MPAPISVDQGLYTQVQQFYARQVQLLGNGDIDRWSETFTEDAVFEQEAERGRVFAGNAPPQRHGRAVIAAAARGAVRQRQEGNVVRRYWIGMLQVEAATDGSVRTRYRAVLFQTVRGSASAVYLSTTGEDVLIRENGDWRVHHRINSHDNAAGVSTGSEEEESHG